jgi:rubredoxin
MPYGFDYFVGNLLCPVCGFISEADESTNMQTYIRNEPELAYLGIGSDLKFTDIINSKDYLVNRIPNPDEEIRILEIWECPSCGKPFNWGEVVVHNEVITNISAVIFDRETFNRANLVSRWCISVAEDLTGRTYQELLKEDLIQILRERL